MGTFWSFRSEIKEERKKEMKIILYIIVLNIPFLSSCDFDSGDRCTTGKKYALLRAREIEATYEEMFLLNKEKSYSPFLFWNIINRQNRIQKKYESRYKLMGFWVIESVDKLTSSSIFFIMEIVIDGKNQYLVVSAFGKGGLDNKYKHIFINKLPDSRIYKNLVKVYDESDSRK